MVYYEQSNIIPEQPYKGSFNIRISPDLHRTIAIYALENGKTLNATVEEALAEYIVKTEFKE